MNPSGIDTDAFYDTYADKIIYLGDTEADGFTQVCIPNGKKINSLQD